MKIRTAFRFIATRISRSVTFRNTGYGLLLVLTLLQFLMLSPAQENSNQLPAISSSQDVLSFINQSISWYRHLSVEQQIATEPEDIVFVNDDRQLATQIVRLSFDFALAYANSPNAAPQTSQGGSSTTPDRAQNLLQIANKADQQVKGTQVEIEDLRHQLETAPLRKRKQIESQIAEVQSELELAQTRRDTLRNMLQFASTASGTGGTLRAQLEELQRVIPAVGDKSNENAVNSNTPSSALHRANATGILGLITDLITLSKKIHTIDETIQLTNNLQQNAKQLRTPFSARLRELVKSGNDIVQQPDSTDPAVLAQQKQQLDAMTAQFKQMAALTTPLSKQNILLDLHKRSLSSWRDAVKSEYNTVLRNLLIRMGVLAFMLAVIFGLGELWRRAIYRYVHDVRRRYQFLLLRRLVIWFLIAIVIAFAVLFANFAEAIAEGRGKAQAESLRNSRTQAKARKMTGKQEALIFATELKKGDVVVCETGDIIPSDGEVIEGIASVDESAITGESAPVIRESGGDRSAVTGGTKVISDRILIRITTEPGDTFIDRMIALVEGAKRQKTPNEIALSILLSGLSIIFLLAVATLPAFFHYSLKASGLPISQNLTIPVLIALLVCLIPTTIGGLLSAIGISGMDRLIRRNVIATSGRAIEAAGDVDVLLLDKTGTITLGNRMATDFIPDEGVTVEELANAAQISSLSDETPEGRSIVILAKEKFGIRGREVHQVNASFIPFTAQSRMSGVDLKAEDGTIHKIRKGSSEAIRTFVQNNNGFYPQKIQDIVNELARQGATPLVVAEDKKVLGVVHLKDIVKGGIKQRFAELRRMGIKTVMITGDNALTAAAIAAEAGVDDFMAESTPEDKLRRIREEQANGHLVGMIGDGTNDAPALAQADVGIAMNTGTQAAREAGNMVDLDSNPTKLIEVVEVGKQLLMTRGSLTTFSIANDIAKYFAIIPAIAIALYSGKNAAGPLSALNIMNLGSPQSAILSAVIFNALIIILLVPLALKGVRYRPVSANEALSRNLLIFGLGGIIAPFAGIKLIDMMINFW